MKKIKKAVKPEDCLAFLGDKYQIEWFFDEKLKSEVKEYFENLSENQQGKLLQMFEVMGTTGLIRNKVKFRNEGDKIYAFKPKPDRFLCFFTKGKKLILTNAFIKKQDKLPQSEKDRAIKRMENYEARIKEDSYYEKESN